MASVTQNPRMKILVVGDSSIGKTNLVYNLIGRSFSSERGPTELNSYWFTIPSANSPTNAFDIQIRDLGGHVENCDARLRCYGDGTHNDIFLVCFSAINRESFENVRKIWRREILPYWDQNTSIVLVGLQSEMRKHRFESGYIPAGITPYDEAKLVTRKLSFSKYVECSAKMSWNVSKVFEEAVRIFSVNEMIDGMLLGNSDAPGDECIAQPAEKGSSKERFYHRKKLYWREAKEKRTIHFIRRV